MKINIPSVKEITLSATTVTINSKFTIMVKVEDLEGDTMINYSNDFYSNEVQGE